MKIFSNVIAQAHDSFSSAMSDCKQSAAAFTSHVIASVAKQSTITRLIFALVFACVFAACGDDSSSSSVSPEPSDDSSSSVVPASSGDESSSSQKNSDKDKSSSSVEKSKSSSSSVVPASSSSSSKKDEKSSSSVKPSSSSEAKSSSSEEVKQSSSSVVASSSSVVGKSSSSEYKPYNHQKVFSSDSLLSGAYKEFTDERNGRKYYYLTINGEDKDGNPASVTVMAENLNIGEMVDGAKDQSNDSKIERYCYENDESNCEEFGGLYQWAEAMQLPSECNTKSCADQIKPKHQGICPDGWRLLTYDDFYIVVHADGNDAGVKGVRAMGFGGHNYSGYSLIGGGMRITPSGGFKEKDEVAYWFYPGENEYENYSCGDDGYSGKTSTSLKTNVSYKQNGLSIRCVKLD